jgi:hypothetical protein
MIKLQKIKLKLKMLNGGGQLKKNCMGISKNIICSMEVGISFFKKPTILFYPHDTQLVSELFL